MITKLLQPRVVRFEEPVGSSKRVIVVALNLETPRIMAFQEEWDGDLLPMSLFLDEIEAYIGKARDFLAQGGR